MSNQNIPPQATFTLFSKLPIELRILIWQFSLPDPRIVKLRVAEQATDPELRWWRRVSSDKAIDECEDDYDAPDFDAEDIIRLDAEVGEYSYYSEEENHWEDYVDGRNPIIQLWPRRDQLENRRIPQKRILRNIERLGLDAIPEEPWRRRPATLYGFQPSTDCPSTMLACREAYMAGSLIISKTFGSLGALPQTFFDYKADILYIPYHANHALSNLIQAIFLRDELANVQNLAIKWSSRASSSYSDDPSNANCVQVLYNLLSSIHQSCPNLKRLIIVSEEYHNTTANPSGAGARDLKFMNTTVDTLGDIRVNGYRIDNEVYSFRYIPGVKLITGGMMEKILKYWKRRQPDWDGKFPEIEYKVVTTVREEKRLLHEAEVYERKHQSGCWWVNPNDRNDFDYFVGDRLDRDVQALLDGL
jgi:hypothetical protein